MIDSDATSLDTYFKTIPHTPLLTAAEEAALAVQMHDPQLSAAERTAARDTLLTANLRLVVSIATTYRDSLALDDLIQEGNLGLARATQDFDPSKGRFSTYATVWIRQHIQRAIENQGRTIRLPVHVQAQQRALRHATQQFMLTHQRDPLLAEQAAAVGASVAHVAHLLAATQSIASLDQPLCVNPNDPSTLGALIAAPAEDWDAALIAEEQRNALHAALALLEERERTVLTLRYRIGEASRTDCRTLAEIGRMLGVSREYVRQVEAKALTAVRAQLADPDD